MTTFTSNYFTPCAGSEAAKFLQDNDVDQALFFNDAFMWAYGNVQCDEWEGMPDVGDVSVADLPDDITLGAMPGYLFRPNKRAGILAEMRKFPQFSDLPDEEIVKAHLKPLCFCAPPDGDEAEYYALMQEHSEPRQVGGKGRREEAVSSEKRQRPPLGWDQAAEMTQPQRFEYILTNAYEMSGEVLNMDEIDERDTIWALFNDHAGALQYALACLKTRNKLAHLPAEQLPFHSLFDLCA